MGSSTSCFWARHRRSTDESTDDLGLTITFGVDGFGTDRLINSFAAAEKYGAPCIVISFGTATTIDVVNKDREYLGGLIAPVPKPTRRRLSWSRQSCQRSRSTSPRT